MLLFVGLGNKGKEYQKHRHNIGFLFIDLLKEFFKIEVSEIQKFSSLMFNFEYKGEKILCAKPQTFMNLSGNSVLQIANFYKILPENIFVFHDEIDIPFNKIKFKIGGGDGGHNGLKSITSVIGSNYNRVRIGIGRHETQEVADFVLSNFKNEELKSLTEELTIILNNFDLLIQKNFNSLANKLN